MAGTDSAPWEPPLNGTEVEHLLGALDRQRATFRWKADARGRSGLTTAIRTSPVTALSGRVPRATTRPSSTRCTTARSPGLVRATPPPSRTAADAQVHLGSDRGFVTSLRRLLFDLLEEYGRHTGHADPLSEAVDGCVGEDPPPGWVPVGAVDDGEGHEPAVAQFEQCRMHGATFRGADLIGAPFTYVDLGGVTFRGAYLRRVTVEGVNLVDVRIATGNFANVVINDVDVVPLVQAELAQSAPGRR